jgi:hypothetical protein
MLKSLRTSAKGSFSTREFGLILQCQYDIRMFLVIPGQYNCAVLGLVIELHKIRVFETAGDVTPERRSFPFPRRDLPHETPPGRAVAVVRSYRVACGQASA